MHKQLSIVINDDLLALAMDIIVDLSIAPMVAVMVNQNNEEAFKWQDTKVVG